MSSTPSHKDRGLAREIRLLNEDSQSRKNRSAPDAVPYTPMFKEKRVIKSDTNWAWAPLNIARQDGFTFNHWVKAEDKSEESPYIHVNKPIRIFKYSDEEYEKYLSENNPPNPTTPFNPSPTDYCSWTKQQTDELFELCEQFDLRFPIIKDRTQTFPEKSLEQIKQRYYSIAKKLLLARSNNNLAAVKDHPILKEEYNFENEVSRKRQWETFFSRNQDDINVERKWREKLKNIENVKVQRRKREKEMKEWKEYEEKEAKRRKLEENQEFEQFQVALLTMLQNNPGLSIESLLAFQNLDLNKLSANLPPQPEAMQVDASGTSPPKDQMPNPVFQMQMQTPQPANLFGTPASLQLPVLTTTTSTPASQVHNNPTAFFQSPDAFTSNLLNIPQNSHLPTPPPNFFNNPPNQQQENVFQIPKQPTSKPTEKPKTPKPKKQPTSQPKPQPKEETPTALENDDFTLKVCAEKYLPSGVYLRSDLMRFTTDQAQWKIVIEETREKFGDEIADPFASAEVHHIFDQLQKRMQQYFELEKSYSKRLRSITAVKEKIAKLKNETESKK